MLVCFFGSADRPLEAARHGCAGLVGRSYAGVRESRVSHGIRATLEPLAPPVVDGGLVAAWVGVSGPGEGAGNTDASIQVGLVAYSDGVNLLYVEVHAGRAYSYSELDQDVPVGESVRVGVLQERSRPGVWRAWVNGAPASPAVELRGSRDWHATATAEMWRDKGTCQHFAYRFDRITVTTGPGNKRTPLIPGERFRDPGYRLAFETPSTFLVSST